MKISIFSVTEKGRKLSQNISEILSENTVVRYTFSKHGDENSVLFSDMKKTVGDVFYATDVLVFVCACGIAVRSIAPFIENKQTDPAVLVIDDNGKFVISLLSGHIGGANRFAEMLAKKMNAQPVVTTATDIGGKFSPDSFAGANGLIITDLNAAKALASAVLDGERLGLVSEYECSNIPSEIEENKACRCGIYIGSENKKPFDITLKLMPKNIVLGIGCKKNTPSGMIEKAVKNALEKNDISFERVCAVTSIDIKQNEKGMIGFCEKYRLLYHTFSADELMSVKGDFTRSDFVKSVTGADNVCERSCSLHTGNKLLFKKYSENGVTVAASEKLIIIDFKKELF